ncbi:hypothetical protein MO973_13265 [Paenibacillus sp. TRM 82003]|nr:hypothetical protein [Paenibacillus sp. TRM 82003]
MLISTLGAKTSAERRGFISRSSVKAMADRKRLVRKDEHVTTVEISVTDEELLRRQNAYHLLSPMQFTKTFRDPYKPIKLIRQGKVHPIQINACDNPYCKWFSQAPA